MLPECLFAGGERWEPSSESGLMFNRSARAWTNNRQFRLFLHGCAFHRDTHEANTRPRLDPTRSSMINPSITLTQHLPSPSLQGRPSH